MAQKLNLEPEPLLQPRQGTAKTMLAIDPGEVHCGMAYFIEEDCVWADEKSPEGLEDHLYKFLPIGTYDKLVWESFHLYPWRAQQQSFSQIKTVEVIGSMRFMARRCGIEVVEQPASIKKIIAGVLRAKKISLKSRGHGPHAKDAELHGYYHLFHPK